MDIIRFADLEGSPWINGGGSLKVIAAGTLAQGGGLDIGAGDHWDWRLSIADVRQPGLFSGLPGIRRVLTLVDGGPLQLTIDGTSRSVASHQPLSFDGGAVTTAELPQGPVRNLNLMCRAGRTEGTVTILPLGEHQLMPHQVAVLLDGHAHASGTALRRFDAVLGSKAAPQVIRGQGTAALVELNPC
ncbi:HutD family protein [Pseudarthrobacter sp. NamE2]|uniref:HutD/Ves family protein n=1 Tax=Pseudarthrobacter sp. NamE2 TaxID=2576838 RepID=UPI0010FD5396|nr:HutD family protein [Pseudarthrobacter sp. NamE2]TLM81080.1 HutD family protein [Pseudarthrobacter sp. NamE2]